MSKLLEHYKLYLTLMIFWILVNMSLDPLNLLVGAAACALAVRLSHGVLYDGDGYFHEPIKPGRLAVYLARLVREIFKSSFAYLARIIRKDSTPFITEVDLEVEDPLVVAIIANSITLTPGTVTVDADGSRLTVLSLKEAGATEETVRREIKDTFERHFLKD